MKWIPTYEKLPEVNTRVIGFGSIPFGEEDIVLIGNYTFSSVRGPLDCSMVDGVTISHWMPLPEHPKEKQ